MKKSGLCYNPKDNLKNLNCQNTVVKALQRSSAVKYFSPLSNAKNSSIFGRGMRAKVPFLVPVARVTEGNKEFSFLQSTHNLNCCDGVSGVCFWTTLIGLVHWNMLL